MKLLYGVVGEGMGHATRSSVILRHLLAQGHEVQIIVSGRAAEYLDRYFPNIERIEGLTMSFEDNELDHAQTFWEFIKRVPDYLGKNQDKFIALADEFMPDAVISDFETFSYLFAKNHDLPVISIDNMQIISRSKIAEDIKKLDYSAYLTAKAFVRSKLPGCHHYLITTFFYPELKRERTSLFPPILRDKILKAKPTLGEHLLVYQTTTTNEVLVDVLKGLKIPAKVYGFNRDQIDENLEFKSFSEEGFIKDLAAAKGILATGGYSLLGEALYLKKPMLSVPLKGQFEQILNAAYLQKLGYGEYHPELTLDAAKHFLEHVETYRTQIEESHTQKDNHAILEALDYLLAELKRS